MEYKNLVVIKHFSSEKDLHYRLNILYVKGSIPITAYFTHVNNGKFVKQPLVFLPRIPELFTYIKTTTKNRKEKAKAHHLLSL